MVEQVKRISDEFYKGEEISPVKVREFLRWYGAERRGQNVVARIRSDLKNHGLVTVPDFQGAWIDGTISFKRVAEEVQEPSESLGTPEATIDNADENTSTEQPTTIAELTWTANDPSYYISKLSAANQGVVSVNPNDSLSCVITKMMIHDYSQLPVMTSERSVHGMISWRSLGVHLSLKREGTEARHAMQPPEIVRHDVSIFDVIGIVAQHDYVLVRDATSKIAGIVTATDLSEQFRSLTEPFLLLSEIENHIRNLIGANFSQADLVSVRDPADSREVQGVADLTFGEYVRLIEEPSRWERLGLGIDRATFCERLEFIRKVRNDVMHFDPDGIQSDQLRGLREFSRALRLLNGS